MKKRCVIIGSGFGGLTCGVILARNGYEVTVLEQGAVAGGCLQCFRRGGVKFETGMHFIGSAAPGEKLDRFFRYLGLDGLPLSRLDTDGYDVVRLHGREYRLANGRQAFIDTLAADFPDQRENLERYFDLIETVAAASNPDAMDTADTSDALIAEYQLRSVDEVIASVITDPLLRQVLVGNLSLYAAQAGKTPFATHAFITDFYNRSAWRIAGGSDEIARRLVEVIGGLGGRVLLRSKAVEIVCDESRATEVRCADGSVHPADVVISAIHPARTMEMVDSPLLRPVFRRRMASLPNTPGAFTVYLKFKEGRVPYINHNCYGYTGSPWGCEEYTEETWPKGYLYMHMCAEPGQTYARSGEIITYMDISELDRWTGTTVGRRGPDYEEFKRRKALKLIALVTRDHPDLADGIDSYHTSTPLTYRDYTGTEDGSLYGVARDVTRANECRVPQRTRIPNLLLSGQNINSHGILGVMVGSIVTCSMLVPAAEIHRQITLASGGDPDLT